MVATNTRLRGASLEVTLKGANLTLVVLSGMLPQQHTYMPYHTCVYSAIVPTALACLHIISFSLIDKCSNSPLLLLPQPLPRHFVPTVLNTRGNDHKIVAFGWL